MKKDNLKKVLIAIDYDPTAQKVAEMGFSIAKAMKAEITLLHVISDPVYYSSTEYSPIMGFSGFMETNPLQLDSIEGVKQAALLFLDRTKHHLGDKSIHTLIKEGDFADSILKAAKEVNADFIILGSHSRKWLENIVMGSVTEKVLHHSLIPLLIIPTKKHK
jgi:nucleotide-binding universal stress UspA family protein